MDRKEVVKKTLAKVERSMDRTVSDFVWIIGTIVLFFVLIVFLGFLVKWFIMLTKSNFWITISATTVIFFVCLRYLLVFLATKRKILMQKQGELACARKK